MVAGYNAIYWMSIPDPPLSALSTVSRREQSCLATLDSFPENNGDCTSTWSTGTSHGRLEGLVAGSVPHP